MTTKYFLVKSKSKKIGNIILRDNNTYSVDYFLNFMTESRVDEARIEAQRIKNNFKITEKIIRDALEERDIKLSKTKTKEPPIKLSSDLNLLKVVVKNEGCIGVIAYNNKPHNNKRVLSLFIPKYSCISQLLKYVRGRGDTRYYGYRFKKLNTVYDRIVSVVKLTLTYASENWKINRETNNPEFFLEKVDAGKYSSLQDFYLSESSKIPLTKGILEVYELDDSGKEKLLEVWDVDEIHLKLRECIKEKQNTISRSFEHYADSVNGLNPFYSPRHLFTLGNAVLFAKHFNMPYYTRFHENSNRIYTFTELEE